MRTSPLPLPPAHLIVAALLTLAGALVLASHLSQTADRALPVSALLGLAFGVVLQRSRFCFYCNARDFFTRRDARGLLGIIVALLVGTLAYHLVFGAFLPNPASGRLPPGAHIGPVSWVLVAGAASFGFGMAFSGSCISAHLYRLGEGSIASWLALAGAALGFGLGFLSWNTLYLGSLQSAPVVWLPSHFGYGGAAALQTFALAALAIWLGVLHRPAPAATDAAWWQRRWPAPVGGVLVGLIAVLAYFRTGPLGVTAELGSVVRTAAAGAAWFPERLEGLDTFAGCATAVKETLWSPNGAFVASLVLGAFAAALFSGDFKPRWPSATECLRNLAGGVLMGWGAMVSLGCTVGTLLSGIMAGALSGWVFAIALFISTWAGWRVREQLGRPAA